MAYLALYRKWRPRTFTEVVGQKHISIPLQRAIEQDRLAHAYLFPVPGVQERPVWPKSWPKR